LRNSGFLRVSEYGQEGTIMNQENPAVDYNMREVHLRVANCNFLLKSRFLDRLAPDRGDQPEV
jgi:hypothetical protein